MRWDLWCPPRTRLPEASMFRNSVIPVHHPRCSAAGGFRAPNPGAPASLQPALARCRPAYAYPAALYGLSEPSQRLLGPEGWPLPRHRGFQAAYVLAVTSKLLRAASLSRGHLLCLTAAAPSVRVRQPAVARLRAIHGALVARASCSGLTSPAIARYGPSESGRRSGARS